MVNFQESTTILNACTKKSGNLSKALRTFPYQHSIFRMNFILQKQNLHVKRSREVYPLQTHLRIEREREGG